MVNVHRPRCLNKGYCQHQTRSSGRCSQPKKHDGCQWMEKIEKKEIQVENFFYKRKNGENRPISADNWIGLEEWLGQEEEQSTS